MGKAGKEQNMENRKMKESCKMNKKLEVKDLIAMGIFSAIYIVVFLAVIMVSGLVPVVYLFSGAIGAVVLGTVYMLYLSKVGKRFSVLILGVIFTTLLGAQVGVWTMFVTGYSMAILAELIASKGKYKSFTLNMVSFIFFSFMPFGVYGAFWLLRDTMLESAKVYGEAHAQRLSELTTTPMLFALIAATIAGAIIGAYIGKKLLKRHFKKSGIV
jgi:energy-coupling factor transport system substrate-specific component